MVFQPASRTLCYWSWLNTWVTSGDTWRHFLDSSSRRLIRSNRNMATTLTSSISPCSKVKQYMITSLYIDIRQPYNIIQALLPFVCITFLQRWRDTVADDTPSDVLQSQFLEACRGAGNTSINRKVLQQMIRLEKTFQHDRHGVCDKLFE